jgi:hypothetical protein
VLIKVRRQKEQSCKSFPPGPRSNLTVKRSNGVGHFFPVEVDAPGLDGILPAYKHAALQAKLTTPIAAALLRGTQRA